MEPSNWLVAVSPNVSIALITIEPSTILALLIRSTFDWPNDNNDDNKKNKPIKVDVGFNVIAVLLTFISIFYALLINYFVFQNF